MARAGYREYDPEFTAAQLLGTVNSLGKNLFTVGDANLDFNNILAQQDQYDKAALETEAAQRKRDYQDTISQGFSDNPDMSLEEAAQLNKRAAGEFGDFDSYRKSVETAQSESDKKKMADLIASGMSEDDLVKEARNLAFQEGRVEDAIKLKPDQPKQYRVGNQIVRETADGFIPVYTAPEKARAGEKESLGRYTSLDTGETIIVNTKNKNDLAKLGDSWVKTDSLDQNDRLAMEGNKAARREEQARQQKEEEAARIKANDEALTKQAIELKKRAAIEGDGSGSMGQSLYNKMIQAKPTVRRRVVMR